VTVFDCGSENGTAFIVMELVAGRTLRQVLDEAGPLPPGQAVAVAAAVCEGLAVAHAAGLVHRDIKPANIAQAGGEVKVLDFGIARADGPGGGTRTLGVVGTAAYLSPEQAAGRVTGPQSDLYSLGCVLFEMLTGTPPFSAESAVGLAYRQVHDDPGVPSARHPGLPPRLDQVTAHLLAKDPAARPPGAAAARAELLAAQAPDATAVLPAPEEGDGPALPGGRRQASRAEIVLAAALAAALVALAAVLMTGAAGHARPAAPPARPAASPYASAAHYDRGGPSAPQGCQAPAGRAAGQRPAPGCGRSCRVRRRPGSRGGGRAGDPAGPVRTCTTTSSNCCSPHRARIPSRSSSKTTSSSRPTTSTSPKDRSPATQPPPCATRWRPSAPLSAPPRPAVPREPYISLTSETAPKIAVAVRGRASSGSQRARGPPARVSA